MKLRVAHVTQGLEVGGQERLLVEMARHYDRERFDWTVIVLGSRGPLADPLEAAGVRILPLDLPTGFRPGIWRQLASLFRAGQYQVVHSHDDRPLIFGMPAAWWASVPCRIHTHHHGALAKITRRQRFLGRLASRCAQHFICVSEDSARHVVEAGISPARVRTIWNGIDLSRFAYQGPAVDGPVVTVARLSPEKDVANLLHAAQRVLAEHPQARFEIAGDGPSREELHRLARDLHVADNVVFHGDVRDIPALLVRARFFVLPSQTEGISLTILEAQARGLPVVATAVGGTPEIVQSGTTGLLVPPRDPDALAHAIRALWCDPARCREMGLAGRARVEKCFDIRKMTRQYETLYEGRPLEASEPACMS